MLVYFALSPTMRSVTLELDGACRIGTRVSTIPSFNSSMRRFQVCLSTHLMRRSNQIVALSPDEAERKDVEPDMKKLISIAILCGADALTGLASSQPSQNNCLSLRATPYFLRLRRNGGCSCVRRTRISGERDSREHGWSAAGSAPRRWSTIHTGESSFEEGVHVVTLGPIFIFDTSGEFFNLVKTNPYAPRLATIRNVMALPGGVAFKSKNTIVGALGVGGAPGGDKDEVCARAGVAKVADRLPN